MFLQLQSSVMARAALPETACSPPKLRPSQLKLHPLSCATLRAQFPFRNHPNFSLHTNFHTLKPETTAAPPTDNNPSNPLEELLNAILKTLNSLKIPAIAVILLSVLLLGDPYSALAASGGRMGGSCFSSSSSSYSSSSGGSSSSSSSGSSSSENSSWSSSSHSSSGGSSSSALLADLAEFFLTVFLLFVGAFILFLCLIGIVRHVTSKQDNSVIKLQVGSLGMVRLFQRELDQIAKEADTSTPAGFCYVLTETILALLRHSDSCISAYSSVDIKSTVQAGEERFNQLVIEERGKFDEETLVNVNGIKRHKSIRQMSSRNEDIVITILVAAKEIHKLPVVNSSSDLKIALQKLGSIASSKIMAVEVLWTPQNESDALSERELLEDYSLLRPL